MRTVAPAVLRSPAAYFADYTRRFLESRYGPGRVFGGGLRVRTTLDLSWQRAAQRAVRMYLGGRNDPAAAVVAIDPRDGAIRAMVGGDFRVAKFNLATQAHRQAGSAFKVFTLATALEDGVSRGPCGTDRRAYRSPTVAAIRTAHRGMSRTTRTKEWAP